MGTKTSTEAERGSSSLASIRDTFSDKIPPLISILGILAVWQVYWQFFNPRGNNYFPSIRYTILQTIEFHERILSGIQTTFTEAIGGFFLALAIGILTGIVFAELTRVRKATMPAVVFGYSLPHAVLAPLFLIWFGRGLFAVMLFVSWFGFFSVFVNTLTGLSQIKPEFYQLGEVLGASRWQMLKKIKIWAALPHISSAAKIAVQQSVVGAIIAEFIATGSGLGYTLLYALNLNENGLLFGGLIILMIFAIVFYKTVEILIDFLVPGTSVE